MHTNQKNIIQQAVHVLGGPNEVARLLRVNPRTIRKWAHPWFLAEDYDAVRAVMVDGDDMPATFVEWEQILTGVERGTHAKGSRVVRVPLRSMEFAEWCEANAQTPDARGRNAYAMAMAQQTRETEDE